MPAALSRFGSLTEFDTLAEFDKGGRVLFWLAADGCN